MTEHATARLATEKADFRPALLARHFAGSLPERRMAKRQGISKRVRFEVFKRDSFKCQYCGKGAPEVILQCDHISPVSKGGAADILNLITACTDCNAGKSDIPLDDKSAIQKQRAQLEDLNQRREQLEMLLQWRDGLNDVAEKTLDAALDAWGDAAVGYSLNERGIQQAKRLLRKYGLNKFLDAVEIASENYIQLEADGKATKDSVETAWKKVGGILRMGDQPEWRRQLYYIRGILRNRLNWVNYNTCMPLMERAVEAGVDVDYIKRLALDCRYWSQFEDWLLETIAECREDGASAQH
jgi:hypothetical protein